MKKGEAENYPVYIGQKILSSEKFKGNLYKGTESHPKLYTQYIMYILDIHNILHQIFYIAI